jgi:hypothetical protein
MDLKDLTPTSETIEVKIVHPTTREPFLNDDGLYVCRGICSSYEEL